MRHAEQVGERFAHRLLQGLLALGQRSVEVEGNQLFHAATPMRGKMMVSIACATPSASLPLVTS